MLFSNLLGNLNGSNKIVKEIQGIKSQLGGESVEVNPKVNNGFFGKIKSYFTDIFDAQNEFAKLNQEAFDETSIDKYVNALKGLNDTQAQSVINSSKLTNEQKQQVMQRYKNSVATTVEAEATEELNEEQLENNAATATGKVIDIQAHKANLNKAASTIAEAEATEKLTKEQLENNAATATGTVTDAGATAGNLTNAGTGVAVGLGSKLSAIWGAIPLVGQVAAIAIAVIGGAIGIAKSLEAVEEAKIEEIKKKAEEAKVAINNLKSSFKETERSTKDISKRFAELSQGIDDFTGKNVSLSTDEYEEFLDLSNQLADLFPSLSRTYDENGNAIVNLSGDVNTVVVSLQSLLDVERELANQEIADKLPDVYAGAKTTVDEYKQELEKQYDLLDSYEIANEEQNKRGISTKRARAQEDSNFVSGIQKGTIAITSELYGDEYEEVYTQYKQLLEASNLLVGQSITTDGYELYVPNAEADTIDPLIQARKDVLLGHSQEEIYKIEEDINNLNRKINNEWSSLSNNLMSGIQTDGNYKMLNDSAQAYVQNAIGNLDYDALVKEFGGDEEGFKKLEEYIQDNVLGLFQNSEVQTITTDLFKLDFSNMSTEEIRSSIMEYINKIIEVAEELGIEGVDSNYLLKIFGLDGHITVANNFDTLKDQIAREVLGVEEGKSMNEGQRQQANNLTYKIDQFAEQYSINTQDEIAAFNDAWEKANGDLDKAFEIYLQQLNEKNKKKTFEEVFNAESFSEQKEELLELARAGEITYDVLESTDEYRKLLDDTGLSAKEVKGEIMNLLSATELLAAASKGTEPLIGAYEEYAEKGFVTAEILEGMADTYKELSSWEDFKITAGDPTKTKEQIQEAFNKLLTEWYIDQDILDGLTEENQEIHIANMEDDNIINARQATDKYLSNKALFTEAANEYQLHIEKGKESYEDYIKNKGELDEEYLTSIGNANAELFNLYGKYYSDDLKNYATLIENKMKLETRLAELKLDLTETFGKDFEYDATKNVVENLEANGLVAHGNNIAALQSIIDSLNYNEEKLAETKSEINDILYVGLDSIMSMDFDGIASGANSSSDTVFDHVETRLNHLNEELEKTKEIAEDTFSDWGDRSNAYKTASTQINQLIEAQKKAKARYQAEANKSGISNFDRQLVEKGDLSIIETLSDDNPRKKQIESYKEWYDKVKACDDAILQLEKDSKEWDRTFRAFRWETFDTLVEQISRVTEEAEYLIGLLAEEDLFDDSGNMTKYATATLGLHLSNIDTYKQLAKDQLEEINTLQKEVASGGADQETIDRYNELIDAHRDNINAIKDEENAILDLVQQGYEKQLEALQEIIDKKKESLNAEKDLYDYQKSIEEKTKKVSSLQKQYDIYKNDDSEEGIAQAQRIKLELEAAQEDLEETEYEKYLSDQESLMDNIISEYEQWMDARLEDENRLLTEIRDKISGESGSILSTLQEIAGKENTVISTDMTTAITKGVSTAINGIAKATVEALGGDASHIGNVGGYAKGTKRSGKEWAWTQEKGVELIRTKDGALLTPLDNSMVFNNESSRRLWEFSQNPVDYLNKLGMQNIAPQINVIAPKMPELSRNVSSSPVINLGGINIVCNEVSNADEIVNDLISNKKFEKAMFSAVGNAMTGGNSLSKFRY